MRIPDQLLVATGNPGKLAEFQELLDPSGVRVLSPAEIGWEGGLLEEGETLEANALQKAATATRATGMASLADDSGLFVDILGGAPGVQSARYAGEEQDSEANCAKLIGALEGVHPDERGAEFRCVIALVTSEGEGRVFAGTCRGRIALKPRGTGGFGYDPLFEVPEDGRTFAEMTSDEKHRISHRGRALAALRAFLSGPSEKEDS
jgi:XTP/dITP diphosphohydrolase